MIFYRFLLSTKPLERANTKLHCCPKAIQTTSMSHTIAPGAMLFHYDVHLNPLNTHQCFKCVFIHISNNKRLISSCLRIDTIDFSLCKPITYCYLNAVRVITTPKILTALLASASSRQVALSGLQYAGPIMSHYPDWPSVQLQYDLFIYFCCSVVPPNLSRFGAQPSYLPALLGY